MPPGIARTPGGKIVVRGTRQGPQLTKPTVSTSRGPGASRAFARTQAQAAPQRRAGGFTSLGHGIVPNIVRDLTDAAIHTPGGIYALGKAQVLDRKDALKNPGPHSILPLLGLGPRTMNLAKAMGVQTVRDVRHPLRHPGYTALDIAGVASAGIGAGTRIAAAGDAFRGAEGAGRLASALSRPGYEGGSLLNRPLAPARVHIYEGQPIRGRYSQNPAARLVQRGHDRLALRKGEAKVAAGASKRVSTISTRKAERLLSEERRVNDAAMKGPALRALALSKNLTDPEDAAIRVVAEGLPVDQVIEAHLNTAATLEKQVKGLRRGGVPGGGTHAQLQIRDATESSQDLLRKAALIQEGKKYLDVGPDGRPVISAKLPHLQHIYDAAERAANTRTARLQKAGLLTGDAARSRVNAPGQLLRGKSVSGGRAVAVERSRTLPEAEARLHYLDSHLDKVYAKIVKRREFMHESDTSASLQGGPSRIVPQDQITRYTRGPLKGRVNLAQLPIGEAVEPMREGARLPRTTKLSRSDKVIIQAQGELQKLAAAPGAHPLIQRFAAMAREAEDLRAGIQAAREKGTPFEGVTEAPSGALGTTTEFHPQAAFQGGRFRVPDVLPSKKAPHGPVAWRGGVPRKPGTLTHEYTGALRKSGGYTTKATRATAEDALLAERYLSVERFRARVLPMGHSVRPADTRTVKWTPVRERPLTSGEATQLRKILAGVDPERISPDEAARIDAQLSSWKENLFPEKQYAGTVPGERVPGVVWVDRRLLGSQRKLVGSLGPLDLVQDAVKGIILYGKPGYVTPNVAGNVLYNVIQQGFLAPKNWGRAVRLDPELGFQIDEVMGEGYARALAEGTRSPITTAVQKAGNFWSRFVDTPFRRSSFLHEAAKVGAKSDGQIQRLLESGRFNGHTIAEVAQRSRDAIVDYERLGPIERDIVRRVLFVYPWIKGSTYYAAQFLRDHPVQAMVFAHLARVAQAKERGDLGPLPSWAQGSIKVFSHNGTPFVVNPTSASPFSTPAQVLQAVSGGFHTPQASEAVGQMASPVGQAAVEAAFGRDLFTGTQLKGGYAKVFGGQLLRGMPQYQLEQRIAQAGNAKTAAKAYPYGIGSAVGQFLGGSSMPRPANLAALNKQAAAPLSPSQKLAAEAKHVLGSKLPGWTPDDRKVLRTAYTRYSQVTDMRAKLHKQTGAGEAYYRAVYPAELDLLRKWGVITRGDEQAAASAAKNAPLDQVKKMRQYLLDHAFEGAYRLVIRNGRRSAGVK